MFDGLPNVVKSYTTISSFVDRNVLILNSESGESEDGADDDNSSCVCVIQ